MDSVGQWHNAMLQKMMDYFHDDYGQNLEYIDYEEYYLGSYGLNDILANYFLDANTSLGYTNTKTYSELMNDIPATYYDYVVDPEVMYDKIINYISSMSQLDTFYIMKSFSIVMEGMDSVKTHETEENYDFEGVIVNVLYELNTLKNIMLNDVNYPDTSHGFNNIAILEYSLSFWKNYYGLNQYSKIKLNIEGMTKKGKDASNVLWAAVADAYSGPYAPVTSTATWYALDKYAGGFWDAVSDKVHGAINKFKR